MTCSIWSPSVGGSSRSARTSAAGSAVLRTCWPRSSPSSGSGPARRRRTAPSLCAQSSASAAAAGRPSSRSATATRRTSRRPTSRRSSRSSAMSDVIVLADADERDLTQLAEYRAVGGYAQLERARGLEPAAIIEELNTANLRGRGGAFFPAGRKMQFIPSKEQIPKPHYVCVNADESEPGTFKDREIINRVPHRLIEGSLIAAD